MMPELHVIAAGSLLDFALNTYGAPVGRAQSIYLYPMTFLEYLAALDETILVERILTTSVQQVMPNIIHKKLLDHVAQYIALGGMPQIVDCWQKTRDPITCTDLHKRILNFYRRDFGKYGRVHQVKYVDALFNAIPCLLGRKFKYSLIEGDYRKRELAPALELLNTASVAHKVHRIAAQGIPLGTDIDLKTYKVLLPDTGLTQSMLDLDLADWFLYPLEQLINKGAITESFVGQELLGYGNPHLNEQLYYWSTDTSTGKAEVDYIIQQESKIVPVEVKSGPGTTLRSLHSFLQSHTKSTLRHQIFNTKLFSF